MERESPAERTDPLLPVITADLVLPVPPPALDDRRLAGLLAELDAEDLLPGEAPAARPAENLPAPRPAPPDPRRARPLVIDSAVIDSAVIDSAVDADPAATHDPTGRYVRREYRPTELPADAMSLTGLSRVGGSRVGTVVFTAFFLGIFLLILVEVVVSLLRVSS